MARTIANGRTEGYFECTDAACGGQRQRPFFYARLDVAQCREIEKSLRSKSQEPERLRYILNWTADAPLQLRLFRGVTPQFEQEAARSYVRGDAIRVTGDTSLNIEFSKYGALMLAEQLADALGRAKEYVELCVPNRRNRRELIEFIPDVEAEGCIPDEHLRLAAASEAEAAHVLGYEDFSDWE